MFCGPLNKLTTVPVKGLLSVMQACSAASITGCLHFFSKKVSWFGTKHCAEYYHAVFIQYIRQSTTFVRSSMLVSTSRIVSSQTCFHGFSTFDMDRLAKIHRRHQKERPKVGEFANLFENDIIEAREEIAPQSSNILQTFVWQWRQVYNPPPTRQHHPP